MNIKDEIFGDLYLDYCWCGNLKLDFLDDSDDVSLLILCDSKQENYDKFTDVQYESFNELISKWDEIQNKIAEKIIEYYQELRFSFGSDDDEEFNELWCEVNTISDIKNRIQLDSVVIPNSCLYDDIHNGQRWIYVTFACDWDEENGIGIEFVNEEISDIGYQDIAF